MRPVPALDIRALADAAAAALTAALPLLTAFAGWAADKLERYHSRFVG